MFKLAMRREKLLCILNLNRNFFTFSSNFVNWQKKIGLLLESTYVFFFENKRSLYHRGQGVNTIARHGGTAPRDHAGRESRHSGGWLRTLRSHHVGTCGPSRSRSLFKTFFPRFCRSRFPKFICAGPFVPFCSLGSCSACS